MTTAAKTYLRPLVTGISISATDGTKTLWEASDVFTDYRDSDLRNLGLNLPGKPTSEMFVDVHEMVEDGTLAQIYGDDDLSKLRLSQAQINAFARDHRANFHPNSYATFFLFTREDEQVNADKSNLFVAFVCVRDDGRLGVGVFEFSIASVWRARARRRFVLPQLVP
jgi:hypothetical protein